MLVVIIFITTLTELKKKSQLHLRISFTTAINVTHFIKSQPEYPLFNILCAEMRNKWLSQGKHLYGWVQANLATFLWNTIFLERTTNKWWFPWKSTVSLSHKGKQLSISAANYIKTPALRKFCKICFYRRGLKSFPNQRFFWWEWWY